MTYLLRLNLVLASFLIWNTPKAEAARSNKLVSEKQTAFRKTNAGYKNCQKLAIHRFKQGESDQIQLKKALSLCREQYPGASLYIECKKQAIEAVKEKRPDAKMELARCKHYLAVVSFDPASTVPLFVAKGQLYFAGIGMNNTIPLKDLSPPNFACDKVQEKMGDIKSADYILFGNHPTKFKALLGFRGPSLREKVKFAGNMHVKKNGFFDSAGFGRIYGPPTSEKTNVFFPSASCQYTGSPGDRYISLAAHYLLDRKDETVTPYFGIAFYNEKQAPFEATAREFLKILGPDYKLLKKNDEFYFLAKAPVTELDDEGDPRNLCADPRPHGFLGVIKKPKEAEGFIEYVLLANIRNLCDYGDRRAARL